MALTRLPECRGRVMVRRLRTTTRCSVSTVLLCAGLARSQPSFTSLAEPAGGSVLGRSMSGDGSVVVGDTSDLGPFRWTATGGVEGLSSGTGGSAYAVSADGAVVA